MADIRDLIKAARYENARWEKCKRELEATEKNKNEANELKVGFDKIEKGVDDKSKNNAKIISEEQIPKKTKLSQLLDKVKENKDKIKKAVVIGMLCTILLNGANLYNKNRKKDAQYKDVPVLTQDEGTVNNQTPETIQDAPSDAETEGIKGKNKGSQKSMNEGVKGGEMETTTESSSGTFKDETTAPDLGTPNNPHNIEYKTDEMTPEQEAQLQEDINKGDTVREFESGIIVTETQQPDNKTNEGGNTGENKGTSDANIIEGGNTEENKGEPDANIQGGSTNVIAEEEKKEPNISDTTNHAAEEQADTSTTLPPPDTTAQEIDEDELLDMAKKTLKEENKIDEAQTVDDEMVK